MANQALPQQLLTSSGLAISLGVSERLIRTAVERGVLTPIRCGRTYGYHPSDLVEIQAKLRAAGLMPVLPTAIRQLIPTPLPTA